MSNRRVFFGRLPLSMSERELQRLCSGFGSVLSVHVAIDQRTGRSRGFGFVEMASEAAAEEVVRELNGHIVEGKSLTSIRVSPAYTTARLRLDGTDPSGSGTDDSALAARSPGR